jgi:hypothetical protein
MTAVTKLAEASIDESAPEPGWTAEAVEALGEDDLVGILLRRMRKLSARGLDPAEALIFASRIHLPIQ